MSKKSIKQIAGNFLGRRVPLSLQKDIFGIREYGKYPSLLSQLGLITERKFNPEELRGYVSVNYKRPDCSRCANDVLESVNGLDLGSFLGSASHEFSFDSDVPGTDRIGLLAHIQGVARIPGVGTENWIVFSKHDLNSPNEAGLAFLEFPQINSNGDAWAESPRTSDKGYPRSFHTNHDTDHVGGMQICAHLLAVGNDCASDEICKGRAWVDFYDVSKPLQPRKVTRHLLNGNQNEPEQWPPGKKPEGKDNTKAHYVSLTKLQDGRYLLFAVGHDDKHGWFYTSDSSIINENTGWHFRQFWDKSKTLPEPSDWDTYQNGNFVTECGSGQLYFVGLGNNRIRNRKGFLDLFKVEVDANGSVIFDRIKRRDVWTHLDGANLRAGGCIHVTPKGELVLYAIEKTTGISIEMTLEEFWNK